MIQSPHVAIIGAGWAGLSAAVALTQKGIKVTLFERSQHLGGRASLAYAANIKAPFALDNGQHVLLGAYKQTLDLFEMLGVDLSQAFFCLPAQWVVPQHMHLTMPLWTTHVQGLWRGPFKQLPIGLALIRHALACKHAILGTLRAAINMQFCKPHSTETVDNWLNRVGCHTEDCAWLWRPLCAATLNTTSDKASATLFWHVIQDGLMAGPAAATMLIPKIDLGQLLPKAANDFLLTQGCTMQTRAPVDFISAIDHPQYRWQINGQTFSDVIIATAPHDAQRLLAPFSSHVSHTCKTNLDSLVALDDEPITTVHLHTGLNALPTAVNILPDAPAPSDDKDANLLQIKHAVLIDRAYLDADQKGWHTVVISSSHACIGQTRQALTASVLKHLADCLPEYDWPTSCDAVIIHAKQATYSCVAGITLPPHDTGLDGVYLAGDYVAHTRSYPATLESAVRSGLNAAQLILNR